MFIVLVILLICEISGFQNITSSCNFICGCEDDLRIRFNKPKALTGNRRGLFDAFPENRYENASYFPSDDKNSK